jgi:hypothetical protein
MSAIREVKFLQELQHPNVIEVRAKGRYLSAVHWGLTRY